jgi:hypothetical protein
MEQILRGTGTSTYIYTCYSILQPIFPITIIQEHQPSKNKGNQGNFTSTWEGSLHTTIVFEPAILDGRVSTAAKLRPVPVEIHWEGEEVLW